jgi:DNA-binding transcriptional ArsR family regulator
LYDADNSTTVKVLLPVGKMGGYGMPTPDVAAVARLIGEPRRAAMLLALMDGSQRPASELARLAGVSPSTASSHLARLTDAGLLAETRQGRHRYYGIATPAVARAVEALLTIAPTVRPRSLRAVQESQDLYWARTCYDHLAGVVAVALTARMEALGWLVNQGTAYALTEAGGAGLAALGIRLEYPPPRRAWARPCLDWSERHPHLGGRLGALLADHAFQCGWLTRRGDRRVAVTDTGVAAFARYFGLVLDPAARVVRSGALPGS